MLGLSDTVTKMVQSLRVKELNLSKRYRMLLCIRVFIGQVPDRLRRYSMLTTSRK